MPKRVIIIDAGWSGLAAAKTYLQINPNVDLTILANHPSIGGTWCASRVHQWLSPDTPRTFYEYTDFRAPTSPEKPCFTGADITDYQTAYAEKHDLLRHVRLNTTVTNISRQGKGWLLTPATADTLFAEKLILSTGHTSTPRLPAIPKTPSNPFTGPIFHSKYFTSHLAALQSPEITCVAIIGACKSAIERIIACVRLNKYVHWIIRPPGSDGGTGASTMIVTDKRNPGICALNVTKAFNAFSPSLYDNLSFV